MIKKMLTILIVLSILLIPAVTAELNSNSYTCEILNNNLIYCSDGWIKNIHGYKIIHDDELMRWALSNNKGLVDMSRVWQDIKAEGYVEQIKINKEKVKWRKGGIIQTQEEFNWLYNNGKGQNPYAEHAGGIKNENL